MSPPLQQSILQGIERCVTGRRAGFRPELVTPNPPTVAARVVLTPPAVRSTLPPEIPQRFAGAGRIADSRNAMTRAGQLRWSNLWYELRPDEDVDVWAGARVDFDPRTNVLDDTQGVVWVNVVPVLGRQSSASGGFYDTPTRHGGVAVVDAVGEVLALRAADGTMFYFDVATGQYVASLPPVAATPAATRAATP